MKPGRREGRFTEVRIGKGDVAGEVGKDEVEQGLAESGIAGSKLMISGIFCSGDGE
jgi:hypothetical protein